jgi:nucleoside-diphosphate-sugar epimerase
MRFLVTGASGVVGRNVFELLSQNSAFEIHGTGRSKSDLTNYTQIDLNNDKSLSSLFNENNYDVVIHCAATIDENPEFDVLKNNLNSTLNVIKASLGTNVKKIFFISTISVIGSIIETPITESHRISPLSTYAYSKKQCEELIHYFCRDKIQFVTLRISSPVGKYMPLRSIFPIFVDNIKNGKNVILKGYSNYKMSFLDLRDLSDLISQIAQVNIDSGIFNIGGKRSYSNLELAKKMITIIKSDSKIIDQTDGDSEETLDWILCHHKIKSIFNFEPQYNIEETIQWVLESHL